MLNCGRSLLASYESGCRFTATNVKDSTCERVVNGIVDGVTGAVLRPCVHIAIASVYIRVGDFGATNSSSTRDLNNQLSNESKNNRIGLSLIEKLHVRIPPDECRGADVVFSGRGSGFTRAIIIEAKI
jgi:hypothetical protein